MPQNINMTLKAPAFNPIVFNPVEYKPQVADINILQRSLAQREARRNQAVQAQNAVDTALGEIESKLNTSELEWFNNYKNDINNQIAESYDVGDYGAAYRTALSLAGQTARDTQILGRVKANEAYNKNMAELKARAAKGDFGESTLAWALEQNPYKYQDITDGNGNIVSGTEWTPSGPVYNDFNFAANALTAFKMISPDKGSFTKSGKTVNEDGTGKGSSTGNQWEKVRMQDILDNMENILAKTPDGLAQVEQAFNVAKWDYKRKKEELANMSEDDPRRVDLQQQINERERLLKDKTTGDFVDYKNFYARRVTDELAAKNLAYDWNFHTEESSADNLARVNPMNIAANNNGGGLDANYYGIYERGANVQFGYNAGANELKEAQNKTSQFFGLTEPIIINQ